MSLKRAMLELVQSIPHGRVATLDDLAAHLKLAPALLATQLARLTEDEREITPWHRVVAAGGAIGRGPHRDQKFGRLAREGVLVSPAGVVQDLSRTRIAAAALGGSGPRETPEKPPPTPAGRSRGIRERPSGGVK